ncbi:MAG: (d)CMP kinase [Epulopiscium sp.]|nr:(d)CMP kinase [Candidatus Epulonipiscium sp.]
MKNYAVALDGPAGSGKSTIAKRVARKKQLLYIDTGAMYRAVAQFCIQNGIDTQKEAAVVEALPHIQIDVIAKEDGQRILLNGEDVTEKVRSQAAGKGASDVAVMLDVRETLTKMQRELAKGNSVIMDGRDIGTNVLPDAQVKIYLDAKVEVRAERRCKELRELGQEADFETVKLQIEQRDAADKNRKYNPLRKAEDAIEIDSSYMTMEEVENMVCSIIEKKIQEKRG